MVLKPDPDVDKPIKDHYQMLRKDSIIHDATKGDVWAKINLAEAFLQTLMDPANIKKTAVITPHSTFKWLVMLMRLSNSPPTQWCRTTSLRLCRSGGSVMLTWMSGLFGPSLG